VLACALLLTFGAWRYARETVRADEQDRFDRIVAVSREAIDRRLDSYVQILLGVRALFAGSATVDREVTDLLQAFGLDGRRHELARNLSHGEQRYLEICLALFAAAAAVSLWVDRPERPQRSIAELLSVGGALAAAAAVSARRSSSSSTSSSAWR